MLRLLTTAASLALGAAAAHATPVQWSSSVGGNDHWYELHNVSLDALQAKSFAESLIWGGTNGYLVTITSTEEQSFLNALNAGDTTSWLGGSDAAVEGDWTWFGGPEAGQSFTHDLWAAGEPNNSGDEDYVVGWWSGDAWNDLYASGVAAVIVEWDALPEAGTGSQVPVPAALPLMLTALGAVGFLARRRQA